MQLPGPVAAAMLVFVSSVMLASGMTLMVSRVLDARRSCCVGLGLVAGLLALGGSAHSQLVRYLPEALTAPVTLAFATALMVHLCTLPLVRRRVETCIALNGASGEAIGLVVEQVAGAWALRRTTADTICHALVELTEVLAARGLGQVTLRLETEDGRVRVRLTHQGAMLPAPTQRPRAEDVLGQGATLEGFAMWMASREALECTRRSHGEQSSVELEYRD
jgi:hypothetical protein